jgi:hypothetical protein
VHDFRPFKLQTLPAAYLACYKLIVLPFELSNVQHNCHREFTPHNLSMTSTQSNSLARSVLPHIHKPSSHTKTHSGHEPEFPIDGVSPQQFLRLVEWFSLDRSTKMTTGCGPSFPDFGLVYKRISARGSKEDAKMLNVYPLETSAVCTTFFENILLIHEHYLAGLIHRQYGEFCYFEANISLDEQMKSQRVIQRKTKVLLKAKPLIKMDRENIAKGVLDALGAQMKDAERPVGVLLTPVTPFLFVPAKEKTENVKISKGKKRKQPAPSAESQQPKMQSQKHGRQSETSDSTLLAPPHKKPRLSATVLEPMTTAKSKQSRGPSKATSSKSTGPSNKRSALPNVKADLLTTGTTTQRHEADMTGSKIEHHTTINVSMTQSVSGKQDIEQLSTPNSKNRMGLPSLTSCLLM